MIAPRAVRAIADDWQNAVDQGLETGEAPVFDGGVYPTPLDGAGPLLAETELAASRRDAMQPLLAAGGGAPWWLLLLLQPADPATPTPPLQVAFTAPDPATHQAAMTAWDRRASPYRPQPANLPTALQAPFTPDARPAAATGLEALLFALAGAQPMRRDGWVAWVAVVVVLILLLLAAIA